MMPPPADQKTAPLPRNQKIAPLLRQPEASDGAAVWQLVSECAPLDRNSMYCNLLQCDHFADTSIIAEHDGDIIGWISAYIVPNEPDTLFIWQVAVAERARGLGLAGRMLQGLLDRAARGGVTALKTTITDDNEASWALFRRFAAAQGAPLEREAHFRRDEHFAGRHATEHMVTIGPFGAEKKAAA